MDRWISSPSHASFSVYELGQRLGVEFPSDNARFEAASRLPLPCEGNALRSSAPPLRAGENGWVDRPREHALGRPQGFVYRCIIGPAGDHQQIDVALGAVGPRRHRAVYESCVDFPCERAESLARRLGDTVDLEREPVKLIENGRAAIRLMMLLVADGGDGH